MYLFLVYKEINECFLTCYFIDACYICVNNRERERERLSWITMIQLMYISGCASPNSNTLTNTGHSYVTVDLHEMVVISKLIIF